jgi:hypothetical protein
MLIGCAPASPRAPRMSRPVRIAELEATAVPPAGWRIERADQTAYTEPATVLTLKQHQAFMSGRNVFHRKWAAVVSLNGDWGLGRHSTPASAPVPWDGARQSAAACRSYCCRSSCDCPSCPDSMKSEATSELRGPAAESCAAGQSVDFAYPASACHRGGPVPGLARTWSRSRVGQGHAARRGCASGTQLPGTRPRGHDVAAHRAAVFGGTP